MIDEGARTAESVIAAISHKATLAGAWTSAIGWLASSQGVSLAGVAIGVLGLVVQWYYRRRQDQRDEIEHVRRMSEFDDYQKTVGGR